MTFIVYRLSKSPKKGAPKRERLFAAYSAASTISLAKRQYILLPNDSILDDNAGRPTSNKTACVWYPKAVLTD